MRVIWTTDKKYNMCSPCLNCIAACEPSVIEFGEGSGNDNVIGCSEYSGKLQHHMTVGEQAPKESESKTESDTFLSEVKRGGGRDLKIDWQKQAREFEGTAWHFWSGRLAVVSDMVIRSSVLSLSENVALLDWVLNNYNFAVEDKTNEK